MNHEQFTTGEYSKSGRVYAALFETMRSGKWRNGQRLPSERELAETFDCSRVSVRAALSRMTEQKLVARVRGSGTYVSGFKPAYGFRQIALVLHDFTVDPANSHYSNLLIGGFLSSCAEYGFSANLIQLKNDEDFPAGMARMNMVFQHYDVFLFCYALSDAELDCLDANQCCFVALMAAVGDRTISYVDINNYHGCYIAMKHFFELGYRRPVFLNGPLENHFNEAKVGGFVKALEEFRIEYRPEWMLRACSGDENEAGEITHELLANSDYRFDCMLVYGDWATIGAVNELRRSGMRIPDDIALIMYDEFSWVSRVLKLSLTVVSQPFSEQISLAVRMAARKLEARGRSNAAVHVIQPSLIIRKSSGIMLSEHMY